MQHKTQIKVLQSSFMQSAQTIKDCPPQSCTEIAMLGRSNVGKSSIINLLLNHKLAKSSSTPGKTKVINFFSTTWELFAINKDSNLSSSKGVTTQHKRGTIYAKNAGESIIQNKIDFMKREQDLLQTESMRIPLVFIDFPGFGYAKVSKDTKRVWDKYLTDFIHKRQSIKLFCHLIDSRHTDLIIDSDIERFLQTILKIRKDCKLLQIYTKNDKLNKSDYHKLKSQNKLTISTLKKNTLDMQRIYHEILNASLNLDYFKPSL